MLHKSSDSDVLTKPFIKALTQDKEHKIAYVFCKV